MPPKDHSIESALQWHLKWKDSNNFCTCPGCSRTHTFAIDYTAVRDGAPFTPSMLEGLEEYQRDAFVRLICLRHIKGEDDATVLGTTEGPGPAK